MVSPYLVSAGTHLSRGGDNGVGRRQEGTSRKIGKARESKVHATRFGYSKWDDLQGVCTVLGSRYYIQVQLLVLVHFRKIERKHHESMKVESCMPICPHSCVCVCVCA